MQEAEVLEFIGKLDAHAAKTGATSKEKFPLRIIGKCALLLAGLKDTVGTSDLDSLAIEGQSDTEINQTVGAALLKEFGIANVRTHGYYFEFVRPALVFLPPRAQWIDLPGNWKATSVKYLAPAENIASKCFSGFSKSPRKKDRADVIAALDQKLVTLSELLPLADRIFDSLEMDARSERFPDVYRYITEVLIPEHGGGELKYRLRED